jgi:hypothetical protein
MLNVLPLLSSPNSPFSIALPSSLTNAVPSFRPTFTRRTNGHNLRNLTAVNFLFPLYNINLILTL